MKTAKRFMAMTMAMVMCVAMLAGCGGSSKDNYLNDLQEIVDMYSELSNLSFDDYDQIVSDMESAIKGLSMKTSEGKAIKSDLQDMVDVLEDVVAAMEDFDLETITEASERMDKISESADEHMEAFLEAAEKAGVSEDDLDSLDLDALDGLF